MSVGSKVNGGEFTDLLDNRNWIHCFDPFPHITATRVFQHAFYDQLVSEFRQLLSNGLSENSSAVGFGRGMQGYDAYGFSFSRDTAGAMKVFISRPWHDLIASAVGIEVTGRINSGLHHHQIGSQSGKVHND